MERDLETLDEGLLVDDGGCELEDIVPAQDDDVDHTMGVWRERERENDGFLEPLQATAGFIDDRIVPQPQLRRLDGESANDSEATILEIGRAHV